MGEQISEMEFYESRRVGFCSMKLFRDPSLPLGGFVIPWGLEVPYWSLFMQLVSKESAECLEDYMADMKARRAIYNF